MKIVVDRRSQTERERLTQDLEQSRKLLAGTLLVPVPACRKCSEQALVKDGRLESDEGRFVSGTAAVPEITICLSNLCGHIAVKKTDGLVGLNWRYGSTRVEIVDGSSFITKEFPQRITKKQRVSIQDAIPDMERKLAQMR